MVSRVNLFYREVSLKVKTTGLNVIPLLSGGWTKTFHCSPTLFSPEMELIKGFQLG